jgi:lysozyme family protein
MPVRLTNALRDEYQRLFDTCETRRPQEVGTLTSAILQNRDHYAEVGTALEIPWYVIGVIHSLESSLSFKKHLHNGDPLTARTVHVPKNRPPTGTPPFRWEVSARDALTLEGLDKVTDWSLPGILFQLEAYNGFGYRNKHPEVLTPYLWSFSNHYTKGKFVDDGVFDPEAASRQCGAAVLLRRMAETGIIQFDSQGAPLPDLDPPSTRPLSDFEPLPTFSETKKSEAARALQRALNLQPGIFLRVDGVPGRRTSDALRKVTGHFLSGDPLAG